MRRFFVFIALVLLASTSYAAVDPIWYSCKGLWRGNSLDYIDSAMGNNTLAVTTGDAPALADGHGSTANSALYWATAGKVGILDADQVGLDITGSLSISFWFKLTNVTGTHILVGKDATSNRSYIVYFSGGYVYFTVTPDGSTATTAYAHTACSIDTWYHITCVYNGTDLKVYRNGSLDCSPIAYSSGLYNGTGPFALGGAAGTLIQNVAIFNIALDATQIGYLYGLGDNIGFSTLPTPIAKYKLSQDAGNTEGWLDESASANHLTGSSDPVAATDYNSQAGLAVGGGGGLFALSRAGASLTGFDTTDEISVRARVKLDSIATTQYLVYMWDTDSKRMWALLYYQTTGKFALYVTHDGGSGSIVAVYSTLTVSAGTWYHVTVSKAGAVIRIQVNAENSVSAACNATLFYNATVPLMLAFAGSLDDVMIWDEEIGPIHNATLYHRTPSEFGGSLVIMTVQALPGGQDNSIFME